MVYVFGPYELDTECYELRHSGTPCQIEPKAFDLLAYLIRQHGHAISKEELLEHLWPGQFVSESALSYCIMAARKAIGDSGRTQQCIKTVHGRGYRFIAPVQERLAARSGAELAAAPQDTPALIGREQEVQLLWERWKQAQAGAGQVVVVSGEGGIGKACLVRLLKDTVVGEVQTWCEGRCLPYYQNSPLYPIIDLVRRRLGSADASPQAQLQQLETALAASGLDSAHMLSLFAALLSLPLPDRLPPLVLSARQQKQQTLAALLAWLQQEAQRHPVPVAIADLQWADPSTLEFLSLLIDQAPTTRMLVLLTFRPDFRPPWPSRSYLTHIALSRLSRGPAERLVARTIGGKALAAEVLQQLVTRAGGVPLCIEELVKLVLASGLVTERQGRYEWTDPLSPPILPAALPDALMVRLERLGTAKQIAQLGAALGQEFPYAWLLAVAPAEAAPLQRDLSQLVDAGVLDQHGAPPQARYAFRHALLQEAVYQSIPPRTRQQYHRQIARGLETRFAELRETHPELLAHHYTAADLHKEAIVYWQKAAQHAIERSAHAEASSYLSQGFESLRSLLAIPERTQQDLALQRTLGTALMAAKGYTAREKEYAYAQARELCPQMGDVPQRFQVLQGLWSWYLIRAEIQTARDLAEQCLHLTQSLPQPRLLLPAHAALGITLLVLGELGPAREHLEQGLSRYNAEPSPRQQATQDLGVSCLAHTAIVLWLQGYPDQAQQHLQEALALASRLTHPLSTVCALIFAARLHQLRQEHHAAQERAEAAITLATAQGLPHWVAQGTALRGSALAEQDHVEEGIAQIRQGLAAYQATGAELARPALLALLAAAYGKAGQAAAGLEAIAEAFAIVHRDAEHHHWEAELYRLQGELLLQSSVQTPGSAVSTPHAVEAEACLQQALAAAKRQQAKSLELRAAISLGQLWQKQGKRHNAHQMLAEVTGWFVEGLDTTAYTAARALLTELA